MKLKLFAIAGSGVAALINKYIFGDFEFLKWLVIAIVIDLITGVTKTWINEGFSAVTSKGIRQTVGKVIQYGSLLIITHVVTNFTVGGESVSQLGFLTKWAYILLLLTEAKSVYENLIEMRPDWDFVAEIMERLKIAGGKSKFRDKDN